MSAITVKKAGALTCKEKDSTLLLQSIVLCVPVVGQMKQQKPLHGTLSLVFCFFFFFASLLSTTLLLSSLHFALLHVFMAFYSTVREEVLFSFAEKCASCPFFFSCCC